MGKSTTKSKQMSVLFSAEERTLLERERVRLDVPSIATVIRMRMRFQELRKASKIKKHKD
jgi:hypothetical protein